MSPSLPLSYRPISRREYRIALALRAAPAALLAIYLWMALFIAGLVPSPAFPIAAGVGILAYGATLRARRNQSASEIAKQHAKVSARMEEGDVEGAAREMDALLAISRDSPAIHSMMVVQRGLLLMREGDLDRAVRLLEGVRREGWLTQPKLAKGNASLLGGLAMLYVASNNPDAATAILRAARAELPTTHQGDLAPLEAATDARAGRFREAIERIELERAHGETSALHPRHRRLMALVFAFSIERAAATNGARDAAPRDSEVTPGGEKTQASANSVAALVDELRPIEPGEFDHIVRAWPELRAFCERNALEAPPPDAPAASSLGLRPTA